MKRMTQIAKELRQHGRMFSQTTLATDLEAFEPLFKEGRVVFYKDDVTDALMSKYKVRPAIITETTVENNDSQLDKIQKMLELICKELELEAA